ncbi:hypothetical protein F3I16_15570 [Pseudomonas sp. L-22-4S-12]|uniref:hypothetical protein n=1 Tax=Pseudomonas sp. L-22-4S-12 TaxID=2610893 RepID=UPI001328E427|nr:hypothetical protein [Pseudomonas sp. L-22-4S-12]MWV17460.1 hypothetical protein [Pseudomonas sp. L-22-4S-12]
MTLRSLLKGIIEFDELSPIVDLNDGELDFESLKEDLLQVSYAGTYLLDVGWYPSFDPSGFFQIRVIKEYDWESPVHITCAKSYKELIGKIVAAQWLILESM